ncbi:BglG family transcription antiterminator [Caviibacter abscessus]|uniref:BglG family transcription antiterminator n=1 Tax=Caviibacter abscessus TaxID=1766719 RepID=UPI000837CF49|nr:PTS sugar transporter subunit IIA [Caviibacter abscessus]
MLGKLIYSVSKRINVDLTKDQILYNFLLSHLKIAIYRLKKNISLDNTYYVDLINKHDKMFHLITEEIQEIEKIYNIVFTKIEISLLCFHFNASLERVIYKDRKKVVLVCALGYGSSKVLEYNLKENFDIDILDVLPIHMLNESLLNDKNIDYILTTSDLDNINAIKINPLLKEEDYKKLMNLGIKNKKRKILVDSFVEDIKNNLGVENKELKKYLLKIYGEYFYTNQMKYSFLINMINENNVRVINSIPTFEEAIKEVGNILIKNKACSVKYVNGMIENVRKFGSYIIVEDGIAIPHSNLETEAYKTDFSILILKKFIKFGNKKAKIFFGYSSTNKYEHLSFLKEFYNLILNKDFLDNLDNINNANDFINYLIQSEV